MRRLINYINPWIMASGLLLVFLLIYAGHFVVVQISGGTMDVLQIWVYVMGASMVYSIFSAINILYAANTSRYYSRAMMGYIALVIVGVILATLISGKSILELQTYRRVFIFVVFTFLVMVTIVTLIKQLENWSRRDDEEFLKKK